MNGGDWKEKLGLLREHMVASESERASSGIASARERARERIHSSRQQGGIAETPRIDVTSPETPVTLERDDVRDDARIMRAAHAIQRRLKKHGGGLYTYLHQTIGTIEHLEKKISERAGEKLPTTKLNQKRESLMLELTETLRAYDTTKEAVESKLSSQKPNVASYESKTSQRAIASSADTSFYINIDGERLSLQEIEARIAAARSSGSLPPEDISALEETLAVAKEKIHAGVHPRHMYRDIKKKSRALVSRTPNAPEELKQGIHTLTKGGLFEALRNKESRETLIQSIDRLAISARSGLRKPDLRRLGPEVLKLWEEMTKREQEIRALLDSSHDVPVDQLDDINKKLSTFHTLSLMLHTNIQQIPLSERVGLIASPKAPRRIKVSAVEDKPAMISMRERHDIVALSATPTQHREEEMVTQTEAQLSKKQSDSAEVRLPTRPSELRNAHEAPLEQDIVTVPVELGGVKGTDAPQPEKVPSEDIGKAHSHPNILPNIPHGTPHTAERRSAQLTLATREGVEALLARPYVGDSTHIQNPAALIQGGSIEIFKLRTSIRREMESYKVALDAGTVRVIDLPQHLLNDIARLDSLTSASRGNENIAPVAPVVPVVVTTAEVATAIPVGSVATFEPIKNPLVTTSTTPSPVSATREKTKKETSKDSMVTQTTLRLRSLQEDYAKGELAHFTEMSRGKHLGRLRRLGIKLGIADIPVEAGRIHAREQLAFMSGEHIDVLHTAMDARMKQTLERTHDPEARKRLEVFNEKLKSRLMFRYIERPLAKLVEQQEQLLTPLQHDAKVTLLSKMNPLREGKWKRAAFLIGGSAVGATAALLAAPTGGASTAVGGFALRKLVTFTLGTTAGTAAASYVGERVREKQIITDKKNIDRLNALKAGKVVERNKGAQRVFDDKNTPTDTSTDTKEILRRKLEVTSDSAIDIVEYRMGADTRKRIAEGVTGAVVGGVTSLSYDSFSRPQVSVESTNTVSKDPSIPRAKASYDRMPQTDAVEIGASNQEGKGNLGSPIQENTTSGTPVTVPRERMVTPDSIDYGHEPGMTKEEIDRYEASQAKVPRATSETHTSGGMSSEHGHFAKGDNPWKYARNNYRDLLGNLTKAQQDHVIDTVKDALRDNTEFRAQVFPGYKGTSFLDMPVGQEVNDEQYREAIIRELERHGAIIEREGITTGSLETADGTVEQTKDDLPQQSATIRETSTRLQSTQNLELVSTPIATPTEAQIHTSYNNLISSIDRKPGWFGSLFSAEQSAYPYLKNMTLEEIQLQLTELPRNEVLRTVGTLAPGVTIDGESLMSWKNQLSSLDRTPTLAFKNFDPKTTTLDTYMKAVARERLAKSAPAIA
jgi:hypothetical protein